ncbi:AraC family transcriptional regulator [Halanaerobium kushneri]|uniref:AraC-like ligand binding domain-containing protein n=1 Tax=Halanaerobium kushneri TaxID=56779 RepID=A0A1N6SS75_9FIRM|nr:AraC family transcriptional regulator [Halanaerobium kushneri]SIQ43877.1 AraC-like ligand binding domain-containing protein [Halanaerobium kushneri]
MLANQIKAKWISRYDYKAGWSFNEHYHSYFQIIYIISGSGSFYYKNIKKEAVSDKLFLIAPGESHKLIADQQITLKTLDIKFDINTTQFSDRLKKAAGEYSGLNQIKNLLEVIWNEGRKKQAFYQEINSSILLQILLKILRKFSLENSSKNIKSGSWDLEKNIENQVCKSFINYVEDNFKKDLFLKDIASELGYNQSYICQCFKECYDLTPMNFLYKFRIKKSAELLKKTDKSLAEIARETGFKTVHHFNRTFNKYQGKPPGEFRKEYLLAVRKDIYLADDFVNKDRLQK